jgi:hypothetical protein
MMQIEKTWTQLYQRVSGYVSKVFIKTTICKRGYFIYDDKKDYQLKLMKQQRTSLQQKAI